MLRHRRHRIAIAALLLAGAALLIATLPPTNQHLAALGKRTAEYLRPPV